MKLCVTEPEFLKKILVPKMGKWAKLLKNLLINFFLYLVYIESLC